MAIQGVPENLPVKKEATPENPLKLNTVHDLKIIQKKKAL